MCINGGMVEQNYAEYLSNVMAAPLSDHPVSWYERQMVSEIRPQSEEYGMPAEQMAGIYAVLSPQLSWSRNIELARNVNACVWITERAPTDITSYQRMKVETFWRGSTPKMGPKEYNFWRGFMGDDDAMCVDRVILSIMVGKDAKEKSGSLFPSTPKAWRLLRTLFEEASIAKGMPIVDLQWRLWEARQDARAAL